MVVRAEADDGHAARGRSVELLVDPLERLADCLDPLVMLLCGPRPRWLARDSVGRVECSSST
eukprot:818525-Pyramimonas_sp.AAC.1